MKDYGRVRGSERPQEIDVKPEKVFVSSNIEEVEVEYEGQTYTEYEYDFVEYDKDEYISDMSGTQEQQSADIDYLMMITEDL